MEKQRILLAVPICVPLLRKAVMIPPPNRKKKEPERSAGFGYLDQPGEGLSVFDSQVRQDLAVQSHSGILQTVDEQAVRQIILPAGGIYADDPQSPKISLLGSTVSVGVSQTLINGLLGGAIEPMPTAVVSPSEF